MIKTLRTMTLAAAGMVGSVTAAWAQSPPPPDPAPAPPAQPAQPAQPTPPPVDFGVAPAALPSAPVTAQPVPTVSWTQPTGDTGATQDQEQEKPPNHFRFTRFTWSNQVSAKLLGVGQDYLSSDDNAYVMGFNLDLRYYFVDTPKDIAWVTGRLGWDVELLNSDSAPTTFLREPFFHDIIVGAGYGHTVYQSQDKATKTIPIVSASLVLPTAPQSYDQGKYLGTNLGTGVQQSVGLRGPKADWFPDVLGFATFTWNHTFWRANVATNTAFSQIPRSVATNGGLCSSSDACNPTENTDDSTGEGYLTHDTLKFNFTYFLSIYKDLSLGNTWEIDLPYQYGASTGCVATPTNSCVSPGSAITNVNTMVPQTTFDVSLSYLLYEVVRLDLGYTNQTSQLAPSGQRYSVFYSPDSVFYGNVAIYLDNIIDKAKSAVEARKQYGTRFHPLSL